MLKWLLIALLVFIILKFGLVILKVIFKLLKWGVIGFLLYELGVFLYTFIPLIASQFF